MAVTAPLEGEMKHDRIPVDDVAVDHIAVDDTAVDDIVIVHDDVEPGGEFDAPVVHTTAGSDPAMRFVYLGIVTLLAMIVLSAVLAL